MFHTCLRWCAKNPPPIRMALMGPYITPYGPIYGPLWAHIWAQMGTYGPMWAHMGPCGPLWVLLDRSWRFRQLSVNFPYDFWINFARFGSRNGILTKFIHDSASFLLEKLKNHIILIRNFNIWPKIPKIPDKSKKIPKIPRFLGIPRDP